MKKTKSILDSIEKKIRVVTIEKHVPEEFFKDGKGLYVWNNFIENIVKKAKTTEANYDLGYLGSFDLIKDSTDAEIEVSLPKKHLFSETEVCAIVATLITKQAKGQKGVLQNNGYANLFYTRSRVVYVGRGGSGWSVRDWDRGDFEWFAGRRVFSPATGI